MNFGGVSKISASPSEGRGIIYETGREIANGVF
jgi:hypothetical protein